MLRILLNLNALVARSWTLAWCLYRLRGIRLIGPPSEVVWYFAYGANMHDGAFRGWRGMRPLEWRPGRVRGYRLRFNLEGHPRGKGAPANVCPDPRAEIWGVLYKITRRDLLRLDATEGVPWWRYRPLWLEAEDASGNALRAVTYIAQGREDDGTPSLRYLSCGRGLEPTACPNTTSAFWNRLSTRDPPTQDEGYRRRGGIAGARSASTRPGHAPMCRQGPG